MGASGSALRKAHEKNQPKIVIDGFDGYDWNKSTEENYHADAPFVGKYTRERSQLDYSYHMKYSESRQLFQDTLIDQFQKTLVYDVKSDWYCESPLENWVVFTAGVMGAGKGRTMNWLAKHKLFPKEAFVHVDPDEIRHLLPEFNHYNKIDHHKTGYLTQKEVGYISEILSYYALGKGKNVLIDGSLRDAVWYSKYFQDLRNSFPKVKLAIIFVDAPIDTIIERANNRAKITGRVVPEEVIRGTAEEIPKSLNVLVPQVDFYAHMMNENHTETYLASCVMKVPAKHADEEEKDEKSVKQLVEEQKLWEMVAVPPLESQDHRRDDEQNNNDHAHGHHVHHKKHVNYKFSNYESNEERILDNWKQTFTDVWEMRCEIPVQWIPHAMEMQAHP